MFFTFIFCYQILDSSEYRQYCNARKPTNSTLPQNLRWSFCWNLENKFNTLKSIFTQSTTKLQWVTDFVGRYLAIVNSSINFLIYCLVAFRSTKTCVKFNWGGSSSHGSNSFGVLLLTKLIGNVRKESSRANHELNVLQLATKTRIPRSFSQQRIILGIYIGNTFREASKTNFW